MRISTTQIFNAGLDAMTRGQSDLMKTQQQLATGQRINSPSDDPSGAVQMLQYREAIDAVEQYQKNADRAEFRLQATEGALDQVGNNMQRIRELVLQANNASQTTESRRSIAVEVEQLLAEVKDIANTRNANGEYIFGGLNSLTRPFTRDADGGVTFNGDGRTRSLQISPVRQLSIGESGGDVFMGIPAGNGTFEVRGDPGNSGEGRIGVSSVSNPGAWTDDTYAIEIAPEDAWTVYDSAGDVVATGVYQPDATIEFSGVSVSLSGRPADGDRFEVRPAGEDSVFEVYRRAIDALRSDTAGGPARARMNNELAAVLQGIDQALAKVADTRSTVGARLGAIETQRSINADHLLQLQTTLSEVRDVDYAEAISRFNQQLTALQAAQQSYAQVSRLSLFDFLR